MSNALVWSAAALLLLAACGEGGAADPPVPEARTRWQVEGRGSGTPAADAARAYFAGQAHDLVAVERASGAVAWRAATGSTAHPTTAGLNVVLAGDVVVLPDDQLYAFDRATGARRWTFAVADDGPGFLNRVAAADNTVYAGSHERGRVYAVDTRTGAARWTTRVTTDSSTKVFGPAVADGTVYACLKRFHRPERGALVALDAATGVVRWVHEFLPDDPVVGSGCSAQPAVAGDLVVVDVDDGAVRAVDRATGIARWRAAPVANGGGVVSPDRRPLVSVGGGIVAGSSGGTLVGIDAATGREIWRGAPAFGSMVDPPTSDGRSVFVRYAGGQLLAVDPQSGVVRWTLGAGRGGADVFVTPPLAAGADVLVGGARYLWALRAQ